MKKKLLLTFSLVCVLISGAAAQCAVAPTFPGCAPATGSALADGDVINAGTTKYFSGTATYASVTVNGGTLIVCGNLSLTNFAINSGTIYVNTGAVLNYNGGGALVAGANTYYYNSGTSLFAGHCIFNGNSTIINEYIFNVPFNYLIIQGTNTVFVNKYSVSCGGIMAWTPSSPACFCLGGNSWMTANYFYNRTANSFVVPSGQACLNVRQYADNSAAVTATSALSVCTGSGISYSGASNWGSATVSTSCSGCLVTLPVELLSFNGHTEESCNVLQWNTASENNSCMFELERSEDAIAFAPAANLSAAGLSTAPISYSYSDHDIDVNNGYFYRLHEIDCDGNSQRSDVVYLSRAGTESALLLFNASSVCIEFRNPEKIGSAVIYDVAGQQMNTALQGTKVDISRLAEGIYILQLSMHDGSMRSCKIRKL